MNDIFQYRKFFSPGIIFLATIFFSSESVCRIFLKSPTPPPPPQKSACRPLNMLSEAQTCSLRPCSHFAKFCFLCPKKTSVNRKPFLVKTVFFFSAITRLSDAVENMSRIFKGPQYFVTRQNPLLLDSYPLSGHVISRT